MSNLWNRVAAHRILIDALTDDRGQGPIGLRFENEVLNRLEQCINLRNLLCDSQMRKEGAQVALNLVRDSGGTTEIAEAVEYVADLLKIELSNS